MKAICLRVRGGPEALAYEASRQPRPGEGEVFVRVHAAGVMHTELSWDQSWTTPTGEPRPWPVILHPRGAKALVIRKPAKGGK